MFKLLDEYGLFINIVITLLCITLLLIDIFYLSKKRSLETGKIVFVSKSRKHKILFGIPYLIGLLGYIFFLCNNLHYSLKDILHYYVTGSLIIASFMYAYIVMPSPAITEKGIAFTFLNHIISFISFKEIIEWNSKDNDTCYTIKYKRNLVYYFSKTMSTI